MVLLEEEKPPMSRRKRIVRRVAIVFLVFGIMLVCGLMALQKAGGTSESLRKGAEDFLSRQTGMVVTIGRFTHMEFYPDLRVDIGDVVFREPRASESVATIGDFRFSMRFWDMIFSRRRLEMMELSDMNAGALIRAPHALHIQSLAIKDDGVEAGAALAGSGTYGGDPFTFRMGLERTVEDGRVFFRRPSGGRFTADLPYLRLEGVLSLLRGGGLKLDPVTVGTPDKIFEGEILLKKKDRRLTLQADLESAGSRAKADVTRENGKYAGTVVFPRLDGIDLPLFTLLIDAGKKIFFSDKTSSDAETSVIALDVRIEQLAWRGRPIGAFSFPLTREKGVFEAKELAGEIGGGTLGGSASLDTNADRPRFAMKASLRDFRYGDLQSSLPVGKGSSGTATAQIDIAGRGRTFDQVRKSMNGKITVIAGEGAFIGAMLDVWDAGLFNIMLPNIKEDVETRLNCMIGAFDLRDGVARPQTLFLDTDDLTIIGKGEIDLGDETIDLKLTPRQKKTTLMDMMTAVRIEGDLYSPKVEPDRFSLGLGIGKLVFGVINPASLALTMTDLGLADRHPCRAYLDGGKRVRE